MARRYSDFPIVLETYRECLRDVLDVPGLEALLRALHTREISLVEVETRAASPFASSLLFDYVATYMYEGDTPSAERRAAALSLDRDLLRELLGQEELRELIDPGALARVEEDLQHRSEMTRATGRDALHDVLRHLGDLTAAEVAERVFAGVDAEALLDELRRERRAVRMRIGGEERFVAADDAGLYRDALGAVPPGGLPEAFIADVPDALRSLVARYARTHGPFAADELRQRYGVDAAAVLRELERDGELVRGELRPGGTERDWCDVEVLRRLRRASLAALRKEIEPADRRRLAAFLPSWQGVDRHSRAGAGVDRLREVLVGLQGLALPVEVWERDVLPRRVGAYSQTWLDALCASGEVVWVGAGPLGRSGRVALYFREDASRARASDGRVLGAFRRRRAGRPRARAAACAPRAGTLLLHRPARRAGSAGGGAARGAVGPRLGRRGDERRVGAAARAAPRARALASPAPPRARPARSPGARASPRGGARERSRRCRGAGRSPTPCSAPRARRSMPPADRRGGARSPNCCSSATASSPASRCSPRA